jgi:tagatose-6-phosphate ketose/aldose isomerase
MSHLRLDDAWEDAWLESAGATWTAREIAQQPLTLARTQSILESRAAEVSAFLAPLVARPDVRIILTGAGSSAFIGECLAPILVRHLNRRVEAIPTTDLLSGPLQYLQADVPTLLVSFGRSGGSPESVAVVKLADRIVTECHQLVITCNEAGALYEYCHGHPHALAILLPAETHDRSFAMTSSFSAMMMAAWLAFCSGDSAARNVTGIAQSVQQVLDQHNSGFKKLAGEAYSRVVYLGSNGFKGLAREAALKLLEMTDGAVAAISDSPLGFRHGPKTFINSDTLVFVLLSSDPYTRRYDLDLLHELRTDARAGRVIAITSHTADVAASGDCFQVDAVGAAGDAGLCFPYLACGQLYALHRSLILGNTPDQPSRSGTVSRVVRGVTIHPF